MLVGPRLVEKVETEEALGEAVDIVRRSFGPAADRGYEDLDVSLVHPVDDPIALASRSQAPIAREFPQEGLALQFRLHGEPVDPVPDPLADAAIGDVRQHGTRRAGEEDAVGGGAHSPRSLLAFSQRTV